MPCSKKIRDETEACILRHRISLLHPFSSFFVPRNAKNIISLVLYRKVLIFLEPLGGNTNELMRWIQLHFTKKIIIFGDETVLPFMGRRLL
jgi:hypothetical protein